MRWPLIVPIELHAARAREAMTATMRDGLRNMRRSMLESTALCVETLK
jgi:hypothetical protein